MKQVKTPSDVPHGKHYAVIIYKTHTYATEASHGYSAGTNHVSSNEHWVTESKDEWVRKIQELEKPTRWSEKDKYVAFEVSHVADVTIQVNVKS